ncbi:hypothetical protein CKM354_000206200 [Cercospora kikuchii]|uniref:Uncharacterized protein n=1 Tax=Cercospora kikuchii TaxID=84275 RepID=A0A9P3C8J0_9PEZI|nr:uncharacterized protein CKM354_000206200 [Cercospora kikuchii]GIZ38652.1 hypothetical protein CKM354_000206200 [Cercospora kikuchii]
MPCRPSLRPAPIEQYLWLTDEVVTEAWHRFLRASNAHHTTGRRYGSNVPGPLEAHRRLSKRRIGMSATGAGVAASGADFGALFGFGGYGGRQFDPTRDLKWKPPGAEKVKKDEHWMFPKSVKRKEDIFGQFLATDENVDAVLVSKVAFDALLKEAQSDIVEVKDLSRVMDFLQSTSDEPEANNILRLCEWMLDKDVTKEAKIAVAHLIAEKVRLRTLHDEYLPDILTSLMSSAKRDSLSITRILDAMKHETLQNISGSVARSLCEKSGLSAGPSKSLMNWLYCLRRSLSFRCANIVDSWRNVHEVLASYFPDPALLAGHLCVFNARAGNLCEMLLQHWIPRLPSQASGSRTDFQGSKRYHFNHQRPDVDAIRKEYLRFRSAKAKTRAGRARQWSSEIALLHALQSNGVAYASLAISMFTILMRDCGAPTLFYRFRELQRHPTLEVPTGLSAPLVRHFVRRRSKAGLAFAVRVFEASPQLSLHDFPDLLLRCAVADKFSASAFWHVLHRQTQRDALAREQRAELIEVAALKIATSPAVAPRVAYRRVWEIYKYLKNHNMPITPVMAKAFVVAGIMRSLEEYQRPPTTRVKYILHVVERIEGAQVAEKLDQAVWALWKKQVLPVFKDRWRMMMAKAREGVQSAIGDTDKKQSVKYNQGLWIKPPNRARFMQTLRKKRAMAAHRKWQDMGMSSLNTVAPTTPFTPLEGVDIDMPKIAEIQPLAPSYSKTSVVDLGPRTDVPHSACESKGAVPSTIAFSPLAAIEINTPEIADPIFPSSTCSKTSAKASSPAPTVEPPATLESTGNGIKVLPAIPLRTHKNALGYGTSQPTKEYPKSNNSTNSGPHDSPSTSPLQAVPTASPSTTAEPPPTIDFVALKREALQHGNVAHCPSTNKIFVLTTPLKYASRSGEAEGDGELIELEIAAARVKKQYEAAQVEGRLLTEEELFFKQNVRRARRLTKPEKGRRRNHRRHERRKQERIAHLQNRE